MSVTGLDLPGLNLPGLSSLPISTGPAISGATQNGRIGDSPITSPFVFDNSGWNVNLKGTGNQSAQGSTGAAQAQPPFSFGGISLPMVAIGVGLWLVVRSLTR